MPDRKFLGNVSDKEEAIRLRDAVAKELVKIGWTPEITVGYERMRGAGGFGVWLIKEGKQPWPKPPLAMQAAWIVQGTSAR